jgi:RimJ/RimL family protein N-acetyltransferase
VGGLGFFGPPDDQGRVELGYGLVAAARGRGLATEAVRAALGIAARHGARSAAADTEERNTASQNVLRKAGFAELRRDGGLVFFTRTVPEEDSTWS